MGSLYICDSCLGLQDVVMMFFLSGAFKLEATPLHAKETNTCKLKVHQFSDLISVFYPYSSGL